MPSDSCLNFKIFDSFQTQIFHGFFGNSINAVDSLSEVKNHFPVDHIFHLSQVHGNEVVILDSNNLREEFEADAIITQLKNIAVVIKVADCQAVQVYDPVEKQIANIHAGWRGVVKGIVPAALKKMKGDPKNFLVGVCPSLGPCCAEFSDPRNELPQEFHHCINNSYVDLWQALEDQLIDSGILLENIERKKTCSKCDENCFSHRRGDTGRMVSVIGFK